MKKQTVFKIIAILLPFILILFIELVLRVVGYGEDYQLFYKVRMEEDKPDYLVMNKNIPKKYFKSMDVRWDTQSDLFLRTKTDSTFRIFVQGASTVVGFPYYHGGSFPRMLKHRLSQTFPEKNIEVINTGVTAVNSYTLWDMTDEIIDQKPDLVILYAGHNEYYGALGVGSSISYGTHPNLVRTYLNLKKSRFFQLLENNFQALFDSDDKQPKTGQTTMMEVMAREQSIPYGSKVFEEGINQYESNLKRILDKYKRHGIAVIISTVVSNEKDIKPFISDSIENRNEFLKNLEQGQPEAKQVAQKNALAAYILGRYYLEKNQDTSKKYLQLAKELDYLRFRAPERINEVIRELAQEYETPLIDMEGVFLAHSPYEVVGDELMTEHVHPNIKGQFLMADAFYNKIKELNLLSSWDNYISYDGAFEDIPITKIDSMYGKIVIDDLKRSWPYDLNMSGALPSRLDYFNLTYEQQKALDVYSKTEHWKDVMRKAYFKYSMDGDYVNGLKVAESLIFEYSTQGEVYGMAGEMCLKLEDFKKAIYYFTKQNQLNKNSLSVQKLAETYIKLDQLDLALKVLKEAKRTGLNDKKLDDLIKETTFKLK